MPPRVPATCATWFLFVRSDCFKHKLAFVVEAHFRNGVDASWLLLSTGAADELRGVYFVAKKILYGVGSFVEQCRGCAICEQLLAKCFKQTAGTL